jgi:Domain of unknown function (DUF1990)
MRGSDASVHRFEQELQMHYARRRRRDSGSPIVALMSLAAAIGFLAVFWRRSAAPRTRTQRAGTKLPRGAMRVADTAALVGDLQTLRVGTGPIFHRTYEIELQETTLDDTDVMQLLQRNFAELAPSFLARFEKTNGRAEQMRIGDEYEITMLGPWNGMVRVLDVTPTSFTLGTLDGHPEAGHITFSVGNNGAATRVVRIESWARARDAAVATAYDTLGIGKQVQTEAWITFLQRLAALAGAGARPEVQITDEEISVSDVPTADVGSNAND